MRSSPRSRESRGMEFRGALRKDSRSTDPSCSAQGLRLLFFFRREWLCSVGFMSAVVASGVLKELWLLGWARAAREATEVGCGSVGPSRFWGPLACFLRLRGDPGSDRSPSPSWSDPQNTDVFECDESWRDVRKGREVAPFWRESCLQPTMAEAAPAGPPPCEGPPAPSPPSATLSFQRLKVAELKRFLTAFSVLPLRSLAIRFQRFP
mmetsp:Transcript_4830/g.14395  ORF Transcript_4830/g.14395 Transcript_4830/m.14395 type:complete len:208 (-) Transcript_4830:803-1426(-)